MTKSLFSRVRGILAAIATAIIATTFVTSIDVGGMLSDLKDAWPNLAPALPPILFTIAVFGVLYVCWFLFSCLRERTNNKQAHTVLNLEQLVGYLSPIDSLDGEILPDANDRIRADIISRKLAEQGVLEAPVLVSAAGAEQLHVLCAYLSAIVEHINQYGLRKTKKARTSLYRAIFPTGVPDLDSENDSSDTSAGESEGMFELEDSLQESVDELLNSMERHSGLMSELTANTNRNIKLVEANTGVKHVAGSREAQKARADTRRAIMNIARGMDDFATRDRQVLPLYEQHLEGALNTMLRLAPIYSEMAKAGSNTKELRTLRKTLRVTLSSLNELAKTTTNTRAAVRAMPRLSTSLNRSKRNVVDVIGGFEDITRKGIELLEQALSALSGR